MAKSLGTQSQVTYQLRAHQTKQNNKKKHCEKSQVCAGVLLQKPEVLFLSNPAA